MVPTGRLAVVTSGGAERVSIDPPKLSPAPTASQLTGLVQETPFSEPTPGGAGVRLQLAPAFEVETMLVAPTAVQEAVEMQLMPERVVAPGAPRSDQVAPPFVVLMTWDPAAKHVVSAGQAMALSAPVKPLGSVCCVQFCPPFVVARTEAPGPGEAEPIAMQCSGSAHAMPLKSFTVEGESSMAHEAPPSVVPMMLGEFELESKSLTA